MTLTDEERCPTCGQRVRTFTPEEGEGTSYYVAVAEQEASKAALLVGALGEVRLYGEKMLRSKDPITRISGADLIQILDGVSGGPPSR